MLARLALARPAEAARTSPSPLQPEVISAVVAAMQAAGATEEMIAAAVGVAGESPNPPPGRPGRPRNYATRAARDRAYYERRKRRDEIHDEILPRDEIHDETRAEWDEMRDEMRVETWIERYAPIQRLCAHPAPLAAPGGG
jgi:hypothetical protein